MSDHDEFLNRYADQLEREYGECVLGRSALISWLSQQIDRLVQLGAPSHAAMEMLDSEYILWQAKNLEMDID